MHQNICWPRGNRSTLTFWLTAPRGEIHDYCYTNNSCSPYLIVLLFLFYVAKALDDMLAAWKSSTLTFWLTAPRGEIHDYCYTNHHNMPVTFLNRFALRCEALRVCSCPLCIINRLWRRVESPPKHLDIFQEAPLRLPKPLSDQFPVRVSLCPLCIIIRLWRRWVNPTTTLCWPKTIRSVWQVTPYLTSHRVNPTWERGARG